eukprot:4298162-Amphidinium_carterae.1
MELGPKDGDEVPQVLFIPAPPQDGLVVKLTNHKYRRLKRKVNNVRSSDMRSLAIMNESQPVIIPPTGRVFLKQLMTILFGLTLLLGSDLSLPVGCPIDVTLPELLSPATRADIQHQVAEEQPYLLHINMFDVSDWPEPGKST